MSNYRVLVELLSGDEGDNYRHTVIIVSHITHPTASSAKWPTATCWSGIKVCRWTSISWTTTKQARRAPPKISPLDEGFGTLQLW